MDHYALISLVFDVGMMAMLAATIICALRLNKHLSVFRSNRNEMERLIRELTTQITRAQEGITTLDDISKTQGEDLRKMVAKARALMDELSIMTESANSVAERLENSATTSRTSPARTLSTPSSSAPSGASVTARRRPLGQADTQSTDTESADTKTNAHHGVASSPANPKSPPKYAEILPRAKKDKLIPAEPPTDSPPHFTIHDSDFERDEPGQNSGLSRSEQDLAAALKSRKK